jgi:hypothetical protein
MRAKRKMFLVEGYQHGRMLQGAGRMSTAYANRSVEITEKAKIQRLENLIAWRRTRD